MAPYVVVTVAAALLFACGNALQKHGISHRLAPLPIATLVRRPLTFAADLARNPLWMTGCAVTVVAFGLETQALGMGDLSVVKPLSRIQSVFVLAIGACLLGERLSRLEWLGIGVMVFGVAWLASEPPDAVSYVPATATSCAVALAIVAVVAVQLSFAGRGPGRSGEISIAVASGTLFGLGDVMMKMGAEGVRVETGGFDLATGSTLAGLVATPEFHLSIGVTALAFGVQQLAFSRGRVSLIAPVIGGGATLLAAGLGFALLREPLEAGRLVAIGIVIAGTLLIAEGGESGSRTAPVLEPEGGNPWSSPSS